MITIGTKRAVIEHGLISHVILVQINLDDVTIDKITQLPNELENYEKEGNAIAIELCGDNDDMKTLVMKTLVEFFAVPQRFTVYHVSCVRKTPTDVFRPVYPWDVLSPEGCVRNIHFFNPSVNEILRASHMRFLNEMSVVKIRSEDTQLDLPDVSAFSRILNLRLVGVNPFCTDTYRIIEHFGYLSGGVLTINLIDSFNIVPNEMFGNALSKSHFNAVYIRIGQNIIPCMSLIAQIAHVPRVKHLLLHMCEMTPCESILLMSVLTGMKHLNLLSFHSMKWRLPTYIDLYGTLGTVATNISLIQVCYGTSTIVNLQNTKALDFYPHCNSTCIQQVLQEKNVASVSDLILRKVTIDNTTMPFFQHVFSTKTIPIRNLMLENIVCTEADRLLLSGMFSPLRSLEILSIYDTQVDAQTIFPFLLKMIENNVGLRYLHVNLPNMNGMLVSILMTYIAKYLPNMTFVDIDYTLNETYHGMAHEATKKLVVDSKVHVHVNLYTTYTSKMMFSNIPSSNPSVHAGTKSWRRCVPFRLLNFSKIHDLLNKIDTLSAPLHAPLASSSNTNKRVRA